MKQAFKKLAAQLPMAWQQGLKRRYYGRQIRNGSFRTWEPEYDMLASMVNADDWALDIGANIGHYTLRLSELVGPAGRIIAFEPVPETFELLAAHVALARHKNVTLFNAAASDSSALCGMHVPKFDDTGLNNYFMAQLVAGAAGLTVLCVAVDSLDLPHPVRLVKIDAEGHDLTVLHGMQSLLRRDHPSLIVEDGSEQVSVFLQQFGYVAEKITGSSNRIFR